MKYVVPAWITVSRLVGSTIIVGLSLFTVCSARADLTWAASVTSVNGSDGGGNWNITGAGNNHWWNGTTNVLWVNGENAIIGVGTGAAGAITIGSGSTGVSVNNLTFNAPSGYSLTQGSTGRNITLAGIITANADATISAIVNGTAGLTKDGSGQLTLAGSTSYPNGYSGVATVLAGTLVLGKSKITANGGVSIPADLNITSNATVRLTSGDQMVTTANLPTATVTVNGTLDMNGQSDIIGALTGGGTITLGAGTLTAGGASPSAFSGVISGGGNFTKSGASTLTLNSAELYTGNTTVNVGTLILSATASISSSTVINVATGATLDASAAGLTLATGQTLRGNGTVLGATTIGDGANLVPGNNAVGALTFGSTLTLSGLGTTTMELNTATSSNDVVYAATSIAYGGTLNVVNLLTNQVGGEVYKLFNAPLLTGTFAAVNLPGLPFGLSWVNNLNADGSISVSGSVTPPPPSGQSITNATLLPGTGIVLSGVGGTNSGPFTVFSTTNVAIGLVNWTPGSTGTFDANGNFIITNAVTSGAGQEFFILHQP